MTEKQIAVTLKCDPTSSGSAAADSGSHHHAPEDGRRNLLSMRIREFPLQPLITVTGDSSIGEAATLMAANGIRSLVVTDEFGCPTGTLTSQDIHGKVLSRGLAISTHVRDVMSSTLIKVDAQDSLIEVLMRMLQYNTNHLLIVDNGEFRGMVTGQDLMSVRAASVLSIADKIEGGQTLENLMPLGGEIKGIVGILMNEGTRASVIMQIISEIHDRLLKRIITLVEKTVGVPPAAYCWILYGSDGRKEEPFRTAQNSAIIYEEVCGEAEVRAKEYFSRFLSLVSDACSACGLLPRPSDGNSKRHERHLTFSGWEQLFTGWVDKPTPYTVLNALGFLDLRSLYGHFELAAELRRKFAANIAGKRAFLKHMAELVTPDNPPLSILKAGLIKNSTAHWDAFNLIAKGIDSIANIARLFSLKMHIAETSTFSRLEYLRGHHELFKEFGDELLNAMERLMHMKVKRECSMALHGLSASGSVAGPNLLERDEQLSLVRAFDVILGLQEEIARRYSIETSEDWA